MIYDVRVQHKKLDFFTVYSVEGFSISDVEGTAKNKFLIDFCNSDTTVSELEAFVIDKSKGNFQAKFCKRCNPLMWQNEISMLASCQIGAYSNRKLRCENCGTEILFSTSESNKEVQGSETKEADKTK